jgi:hypothetical protein
MRALSVLPTFILCLFSITFFSQLSFASTHRCDEVFQSELEIRFKKLTSPDLIHQEIIQNAWSTVQQISKRLKDFQNQNFNLSKEDQDKSSKQIQQSLVHLMIQNEYLEQNMPLPILQKLATQLMDGPSNTDKIISSVQNMILQRRQLYVDRNMLSPSYLSAKPLNLHEAIEFKEWPQFDVYSFEKQRTTAELMVLLPQIDRLWPRPLSKGFHVHKPRVLIISLSDIPGAHIAIFDNITTMNNVFYRASHYTEVAPELIHGIEMFGNKAGGHDLTGVALEQFDKERSKNFLQDARRMKSTDYRKRFLQEDEFFRREIQPRIQKDSAENVVYISSPSDTSSERVVSHEVHHARFFLNKSYKNAVIDYYNHHLSKKQQELFEKTIEWVGYNAQDRELMANEFQAHMLEIFHILPNDIAEIHQLEKVKKTLRPPFIQFLRENGF